LGVSENDDGAISDATTQIDVVEAKLRQAELARMLSGPVDHANAIVSIAAGEGGTESRDWAQMLMRMYLRWCERRGFKTEIVDYQEGEEAGISAAAFTVSGPSAYGYIRAETC